MLRIRTVSFFATKGLETSNAPADQFFSRKLVIRFTQGLLVSSDAAKAGVPEMEYLGGQLRDTLRVWSDNEANIRRSWTAAA